MLNELQMPGPHQLMCVCCLQTCATLTRIRSIQTELHLLPPKLKGVSACPRLECWILHVHSPGNVVPSPKGCSIRNLDYAQTLRFGGKYLAGNHLLGYEMARRDKAQGRLRCCQNSDPHSLFGLESILQCRRNKNVPGAETD